MIEHYYQPFEKLNFNNETCFLTGAKSISKLTVFPQWILANYQLHDKPFKLLDESITTYQDITVPCSSDALLAITKLENEIETAFNLGYNAVKALDEERLFQWIAKFVYGMIYHEIIIGLRQQARTGEYMNFSQSLVHKFSNFHLMLQSIIRTIEFEGSKPWSISIFKVNNAPQKFSYRDEINTLTFALRMNDFGIIACLQDNGANKQYHQEILNKVASHQLHPIQFEEISGRFFYSAYLFNRLPEYTILPTQEAIYIEAMPLRGISSKPLFDTWDNKTLGKVLENFWQQWEILLLEIIKNPEKPITFLSEENGDFKPADSIELTL